MINRELLDIFLDMMDDGDNGGKETGNNSSGRSQRDFIKTMLDYSDNFKDTK